MPFRDVFSQFNADELAIMRAAYEGAIAELGLSLSDGDCSVREQLAATIVDLAKKGGRDVQELKQRAVRIVRNLPTLPLEPER